MESFHPLSQSFLGDPSAKAKDRENAFTVVFLEACERPVALRKWQKCG
jgi:hypothetical protein